MSTATYQPSGLEAHYAHKALLIREADALWLRLMGARDAARRRYLRRLFGRETTDE